MNSAGQSLNRNMIKKQTLPNVVPDFDFAFMNWLSRQRFSYISMLLRPRTKVLSEYKP
jgi:hypothetical protein